jgi:hypothetical protein
MRLRPRKDRERVRLSPTRLMSPEASLLVLSLRHVLHIGIMEIDCDGENMGYNRISRKRIAFNLLESLRALFALSNHCMATKINNLY